MGLVAWPREVPYPTQEKKIPHLALNFPFGWGSGPGEHTSTGPNRPLPRSSKGLASYWLAGVSEHTWLAFGGSFSAAKSHGERNIFCF